MDLRQLAKAAAGKLHLLTEEEKRLLLKEIEELEASDAKRQAQGYFMPFVKRMWPGFIPGRHHEIVASAFEDVVNGKNKRLIINMAPRHAIMTSMMIPTTKGWKSMLDLQVGDYVFGPDGKPTQVLGKSEVFVGRDLYEVKTDDGATLTVDGEHLWTVRLNRKRNVYRDYTTEQLWRRQNGEVLRTKRSGEVEFVAGKTQKNPRLPRLPDVSPVEYERKELLIDPYVFGVWLGDGHSSQAVITMEDHDAKIVRAEIERRGYKTTDQSTKMTFGIIGLKVKLRELGVLGEKHIPSHYLEGSPDQRRDLLKGLMDTDGCVSKAGQCSFAQSNRFIIDDVRELLASLGIKNSLSVTEAKIGQKSYGQTYRISFYAKDIAILPRKEDRTKQIKETFGRYISIKRLEQTGNTQCIKVAREDGLFLAGAGYICTHNTKSEFASFLLPAWFLGKNPEKKVIQTSHTAELAVGFGRKVRNLIDSEEYHAVFDDVKLKADNKSAGRWATNKGGEYFSIGVGGSVTGKGADLLIIDDPHSEQEAKLAAHKPDIFDAVYEWYTSGPRQRLQPGGAIIIVMTRWSLRDLTGQVIKASQTRGGDEWEVIELPAIMPSGKPVWPEFWKLEELMALKEELPVGKWNAQYQQQPTAEEGAIVKREWWMRWEHDRPPPVDFIIQSWDTAFLKSTRADFSACTTWGVWTTEEGDTNIILLDAFKDRYEFPELKQKAYETYKEWEPDVFLVEAKAAGSPLIFELRRMGIPVSEYSPTKGNDKVVRLNAVSDLFASGRIWVPERKFADELIEEVAAFPAGEHDDLCLVGETMITMADGSQKRIDQVLIGEMVATPEGPCKVIDARCTGKHKTIKLNIGNTSLQITPNHPVATHRGWVQAGHINPTDAILMQSNIGGLSWDLRLKGFKSKLLSLMGIATAGIPMQNNPPIGSIFQGQTVFCTGISGNFTMAPYQQAIKFTTKTGMRQIIDWKTWSALASKSTEQNTLMSTLPVEKQSFLKNILKVLGTWPRHGIAAQKVLHGIRSTPKEASLNVTQTGGPKNPWLVGLARFAQNPLRATTHANLSVQQLARLRNATINYAKSSSISLTNVCTAILNSLRFRPKRNIVAVSAIKPTIVSAENSLVYNLTVEKASCYFANGVLVHNCDSMTQALLRFRTGGFLSLQSDDEDREPMYRRKVAYY